MCTFTNASGGTGHLRAKPPDRTHPQTKLSLFRRITRVDALCSSRFFHGNGLDLVNEVVLADIDGLKIEPLQDLSATLRTKLKTLAKRLNSLFETVRHVIYTFHIDGVSFS